MPSEGVPWAIGESGTSVTCTIQGFIYITFFLAFPFYYASLSVYACKQNDLIVPIWLKDILFFASDVH